MEVQSTTTYAGVECVVFTFTLKYAYSQTVLFTFSIMKGDPMKKVSCLLSILTVCSILMTSVHAATGEICSGVPLAPEGWNESSAAQRIYGHSTAKDSTGKVDTKDNAVDEVDSNYGKTPLAPEGWNESAAAKLLYGSGEPDAITVYSSILVSVHTPCDQDWRDTYPDSWMWEASRAIEEADELMIEKFSIDLRVTRQSLWETDTTTGDGSNLLEEAWEDQGLRSCQLMIAFTGKSFPYGGWGQVDGAGTLIIDQGYPANASVVRHEVGHNYGYPDQYTLENPPVCFMNDCYNEFNSICTSCYDTWYANRNSK